MDPFLALGAPIVLGLVQAFRPVLADRWLPLLSIALGGFVAAGYGVSGELPWPEVPVAGLVLGLAASGLYSGGRTTLGAK